MRFLGALLATLVAVAAVGCCTARPTQAPMDLQEFRTRQAARVERTGAVTATGTLELRWLDADGNHFESVEAQWWLERPESMALLLKKLGERMALAGRDGDQAWVIDLRPKPPQLRVIERGEEPEGWAQALLPMHLPWLLGVAPLPSGEPRRTWDEAGLAWARWDDHAIGWDHRGLPRAARILVGDRIVAESTLDDGQWRSLGGVDVLCGHCTLRSPEHEATADLYLYEPTSFEPGSKAKVLELAAIRAALQPEVVP
ncbi:MAG: hypothetical protein FJ254_09470 [Phycisphaerae bacterium]|nr:hypothetical protein [Phycisphaerae bacterium]